MEARRSMEELRALLLGLRAEPSRAAEILGGLSGSDRRRLTALALAVADPVAQDIVRGALADEGLGAAGYGELLVRLPPEDRDEIEQAQLAAVAALPDPTPPPPPGRRRRRTPWERIRDILETFVVAIVAALFIRQYLIEPYKIPTGSMAPGLRGVHCDVACPACGWVFETGSSDHPITPGSWGPKGECPNCGKVTPLEEGFKRRGDKILANKLVYLLRPPRRWEVVVFHYAVRNKTFIKRLAGLPGDLLEIRRGDLYVNGRIAERPPEVQEGMRVPIYDLRFDAPGSAGGPWRFDQAVVKRDGPEGSKGKAFRFGAEGAPWGEMAFSRDIDDRLCYNAAGASSSQPVGDLRVELACDLPQGGGIGCEIQEDGTSYLWKLAGDGSGFACSRDGADAGGSLPALPPGLHRIAFQNLDDVQTLEIDGAEVWRRHTPTDLSSAASSGLRILGKGGARVTALSVWRDSAYAQSDAVVAREGRPLAIPPGRYFFLGDNSLSSDDGRKWARRAEDAATSDDSTIPEEDILGRAFVAVIHLDLPWSMPSWRELECRRIR